MYFLFKCESFQSQHSLRIPALRSLQRYRVRFGSQQRTGFEIIKFNTPFSSHAKYQNDKMFTD